MKPRLRLVGMAMLVGVLAAATSPSAAAPVTITYGLVSWNQLHWVVMAGTAKGQFAYALPEFAVRT